jgi:hypothetical protein
VGPYLDIWERRRIIGRAPGPRSNQAGLTISSAELFALQNAVAKPMGSKQDDHNRGECDGSKASGFDAWVDLNNPLNPEEYKAGYRHGLQQQGKRSAAIGTSNRPRLDDKGGGGGGGGSRGSGEAPVLRGLLLILLIGFVFYVTEDYRKHHPEHFEVDIAVLDGDHRHPIRFLEYKPGAQQRINFSIWWGGGVYSGKPFVVSLLLSGKTLFTRHFETTDQASSGFYLPYDSEFQPGHYVARVSLEGVGTRDYDFGVGLENDIGGINLGDPPVQPAHENGLTIFITDSFQGSRPWPPKNVIYAVSAEPKWLYATVQADRSSGGATSVSTTVICGASPLLNQPHRDYAKFDGLPFLGAKTGARPLRRTRFSQ